MPERAATKAPKNDGTRLALVSAHRTIERLREERDDALMVVGRLTLEVERLKRLPAVESNAAPSRVVVVPSRRTA